jgi:hypothetical protein
VTAFSKNDRINVLVRRLLREGWRIERGGTHWKVFAPGGGFISVPGTPSDRRAFLNFRADVRRIKRTNEQPHHEPPSDGL